MAAHARAAGRWVQPLGGEQHARFRELLVEFAHLGHHLAGRHLTGFALRRGFDQH
jgi:hypothetical protein